MSGAKRVAIVVLTIVALTTAAAWASRRRIEVAWLRHVLARPALNRAERVEAALARLVELDRAAAAAALPDALEATAFQVARHPPQMPFTVKDRVIQVLAPQGHEGPTLHVLQRGDELAAAGALDHAQRMSLARGWLSLVNAALALPAEQIQTGPEQAYTSCHLEVAIGFDIPHAVTLCGTATLLLDGAPAAELPLRLGPPGAMLGRRLGVANADVWIPSFPCADPARCPLAIARARGAKQAACAFDVRLVDLAGGVAVTRTMTTNPVPVP